MTEYAYGYCGMPCALCTRYRIVGKSRCPGCSHDGYYTEPCKVYHCCREKQLSHCGACEGFPCVKLGKMGDFSDLNTGRVKERTCNYITAHGFDTWYQDYARRVDLLTIALERYNNGRMKRYLCELFIRQELETLEEIMRQADTLSGSPKELGKAFQELTESLCVPTQVENNMAKPLFEMSLEELWQLFPIQLTAHQPDWAAWYLEEEASLARVLPENAILHHIGSTAIPGIWAKPIIDILVEVDLIKFDSVQLLIEKCGYLRMSQNNTRIDFNKGYTPDGFAEKVFHLHLSGYGDRDELYFRNYLNEHPEIAKEYETLKLALWKQFKHDRDGYTNAKTDFVRRYTQEAKSQCEIHYGSDLKF